MLDRLITHIRFSEKIRKNKVTYYVSKIPIIKYLIPEDPYNPKSNKIFINILSVISFLFKILVSNLSMGLLYMGVITFLIKGDFGATWIVYGTFMFSIMKAINVPSYIAGTPEIYRSLIYHLRVEPKEISSSIRAAYFLRGILNRLYLFMIMPNLYFTILAFGAWFAGIIITDAFQLRYFKKHEAIFLDQSNFNAKNGALRALLYFLILSLVALPISGVYVFIDMNPVFIGVIVLVLILWAVYFEFKARQDFDYKAMMRSYIAGYAENVDTKDLAKMVRDKNVKQVSRDYDKKDVGSGFVMLNNIFFSRYSKMWRKRFWINFGVIILFTSGTLVMVILESQFGFDLDTNLNGIFGIIMLGTYYLNFGDSITQTLFYNCDSSLLGYRMYNVSENVLSNFIQRLKHIIWVHLPQSIVLSIGLVFLTKFAEPQTSVFMLGFVFLAFMALSLMFCIHSLVNYYLFQPYTMNLELKGIGYHIMSTMAYVFVYTLSSMDLSWVTILKVILVTSVIYFPIASILVYSLAPKRFKVKR